VETLKALADNESAPVDAVAMARMDLGAIARAVTAARKRPADPAVKAHLAAIAHLVDEYSGDDPVVALKKAAADLANKK
jgi:hypothetical protein